MVIANIEKAISPETEWLVNLEIETNGLHIFNFSKVIVWLSVFNQIEPLA